MMPSAVEEILRAQLLEWFEQNPPRDGTISVNNDEVGLSTARNGREDNQDRAVFARFRSARADRSFTLAAVLDGIGGLLDGGKCAELAIASILAALVSLPRQKSRVSLVEALNLANRTVNETYKGRGGATFAGVFFEGSRGRSINIGDTRIYQHDVSRGGLLRQSSDDRLGDQIAKLKGLENIALDPELAARLGQYLGMEDRIRPNVRMIDSEAVRSAVSYFLLLTDGAYFVGEESIAETFAHHFDPPQISERLVTRASEADSDNATVLCAKANFMSLRNKPARSEVEQLQVWTLGGFFSFVFPVRNFHSGVRRSRAKAKMGKPSLTSGEATSKTESRDPEAKEKSAEKEQKPAEKPKRQVIIQELKFDSGDESAE